MSVAFIFPGQGSQSPGMLHHLLDHPAVVRTVDEISEVLHSDVRNLDSELGLKSDVSVQLTLLAAGIATARATMWSSPWRWQSLHPMPRTRWMSSCPLK